MAFTTPGTAVAGSVLTSAFWNTNVRDNSNALYQSIQRLAFVPRTTNYTSTATTFATSTDIFPNDISFTSDGTSAYLIEFSAGRIVQPASNDSFFIISLTDGGNTARGVIGSIGVTNGDSARCTVMYRTYLTFTAGVVTLNARGIVNTGTGTLNAGTGGTGGDGFFPAHLAVYGPPLA